MPVAEEGTGSNSALQLLEGAGAWMESPNVCANPSDYPSFPRLILAILPHFQLAEEREAAQATGKRLQPYKLTPLFIIFLSAIA